MAAGAIAIVWIGLLGQLQDNVYHFCGVTVKRSTKRSLYYSVKARRPTPAGTRRFGAGLTSRPNLDECSIAYWLANQDYVRGVRNA